MQPDKFTTIEKKERPNPEIEFLAVKAKAIKEGKIVYGKDGNFEYAVAPNGQNSNLNEKQWVQVRTSFFKDWFGDWEMDPENASRTVDENGEPMVLYHGSKAELESFNPSEENDEGLVFFGNEGSVYQGGVVNQMYPCFSNARRVKVLQTDYEIGAGYELLSKYKKDFDALLFVGIYKANDGLVDSDSFEDNLLIKIVTYLRNLGWTDEKIQKLDDSGLESREAELIIQELIDKHGIGGLPVQEFAVYDPKNIKSAVKNNGSFSKKETNIFK